MNNSTAKSRSSGCKHYILIGARINNVLFSRASEKNFASSMALKIMRENNAACPMRADFTIVHYIICAITDI
jgi:hypothetical protein